MRIKMTAKDRRWMLLLFFGMLLLTGIPAMMMHLPVVIDDLGTMANPAFLVGYNWGDALTASGGYYYKYGQTLLWILPFYLIKDSVILYRTLIFINAICISVTPVIAYLICRKHLLISSEKKSALFAAVSTMLSSAMLYSLYARSDVMLIVIPWLMVYYLLESYGAETKKRSIRYSIFLAICAVYNYMCHNRGIVVIIAVCMTIIIARWFRKEKVVHLPSFLTALGIMLVLDIILTQYFKIAIWGAEGIQRNTMETFRWDALKDMLTVPGIKTLIRLAVGWLFNAFTSTAGMVAAGLVTGFITIYLWLKKSNRISGEIGILTVFGLLNFVGNFAMGMLFFFRVVHKYILGDTDKRGDRIIYDRYLVGAFGILCLLALYELLWKKDIFKLKSKIVTALGYLSILLLFIFCVAPYLNGKEVAMRYFISLNVFTDMKKGSMGGVFENLSSSLIQIGIIMFIIFLIILIISMGKRAMGLCGIIGLSSLTLYTVNCKKIRIDEDAARYDRMLPVYNVMNPIKEVAKEYPLVLVSSGAVPIKTQQFMLKEFKTIDKDYLEKKDISDMFIICSQLPEVEKLFGGNYYLFKEIDYSRSSNNLIYVKGEGLKDKLESMGVALELYAVTN